MSSNRVRLFYLVLVALAGTQLGHLVSYSARFGTDASGMQSAGTHAYFVPVATAIGSVTAASLLLALLLIGAARLFAGRKLGYRTQSGWRFMQVLPLLFALQFATYVAQESLESWVSGTTLPVAAGLLLWGALGQLPIAVVGALVLSWLATRLEAATAALDLRLVHFEDVPVALSVPHVPAAVRQTTTHLAVAAPRALVKRGPPSLLLIQL